MNLNNYFKICILLFIGFISFKVSAALSTVSSGAILSAQDWNDLINKVNSLEATVNSQSGAITTLSSTISSIPAGSVVAFNLSACPSGWSAYTGANGRVIVGVGSDGLGNTYTLGSQGGEARHTLSISEMPSHNHGVSDPGHSHRVRPANNSQGLSTGGGWDGPGIGGGRSNGATTNIGIQANGGGSSHENRPPYVALIYCKKN